jgi:hypothetical protein
VHPLDLLVNKLQGEVMSSISFRTLSTPQDD